MPSRADLDRLVKANAAIRELATRDVGALWLALAGETAGRVAAALVEATPLLVEKYGEVAAMVAADFYDTQRDITGPARRFTATLADATPRERVVASVRWAVAPMFAPEPDDGAVLGRLVQVVDDRTIGQGKRTQVLNARADPASPRVARVPYGQTCAWCRMLASRGPVYASDATALAASHARCDCVPIPIWRGSDMPEGYDPRELLAEYERARNAVGSTRPKAILAEMRKQNGIA